MFLTPATSVIGVALDLACKEESLTPTPLIDPLTYPAAKPIRVLEEEEMTSKPSKPRLLIALALVS